MVSDLLRAIDCQECGARFFLSGRCFRGHRYCSDTCRRQARRRQCRAAQVTYLAKQPDRPWSSRSPRGQVARVSDLLWAIDCQECGARFHLCRRCFRGQRYCSDPCRRQARRRQCRAAQERYLSKRQGRLRRAAAMAAYRGRVGVGDRSAEPGAESDRSSYRSAADSVRQQTPEAVVEAFCARC
jgi:hypothetical protein